MPEAGARESGARPRIAVLVAGLVALALKLALASSTTGTADVGTFLYYLRQFEEHGAVLLYRNDPDFNHPPLALWMLAGIGRLSERTGLSLPLALRLPAILADAGSLWLLASHVPTGARSASTRTTLLLVALAPASIFVSGFHGNTDPVMVFFLLLSLRWLEAPARPWLAGAAMGASVSIKVVPLVFWPAVFLGLRGRRTRLAYFAGALAFAAVAAGPVLLEAPGLLARKVLGYRSDYGVFGLPWLFLTLREELPRLDAFYREHGRLVLAAVLLGLTAWMNRRRERPPLFRQVGVLAFAFLAVTPGFGVQYLAWTVPWIVGLPVAAALPHVAASGLFLALVYTCWCQGEPSPRFDSNWLGAEFWRRGLPWREALANPWALFRGGIVPVAIALWLSIVVVLWVQLRSMRRGEGERAGADS